MQRLLTLLTFLTFCFPVFSQTQTFIIHDGYFGNGTFTLVTSGVTENANAVVATSTDVPDSVEIVFGNEGRSAYLNFRENGHFFKFEIPLYSLAYNACAYSYSWFTEASIKSGKITTGVYEVWLDPMGKRYDGFCSKDCPTLHSLKTGTPPPAPPAMPELFETLDSLNYGFRFHYSREEEIWHAYWYQADNPESGDPTYAIKISWLTADFYKIEQIGFAKKGPGQTYLLNFMRLVGKATARDFLKYFPESQTQFTVTESEILKVFK